MKPKGKKIRMESERNNFQGSWIKHNNEVAPCHPAEQPVTGLASLIFPSSTEYSIAGIISKKWTLF